MGKAKRLHHRQLERGFAGLERAEQIQGRKQRARRHRARFDRSFHAGGGVGSNLNGTIQALPDIIQTLRDKGYQFVDLAELLHTAKYR